MGIDFVMEAFSQEWEFQAARAEANGDTSNFPVQDYDYLEHTVNCLAAILKSKGIGSDPDSGTDGEDVNMPISLARFRIRGRLQDYAARAGSG
jgi:hypothetical protein